MSDEGFARPSRPTDAEGEPTGPRTPERGPGKARTPIRPRAPASAKPQKIGFIRFTVRVFRVHGIVFDIVEGHQGEGPKKATMLLVVKPHLFEITNSIITMLYRQVGELAQTGVRSAPMLCLSNVVLTCSPRLLSFHWRARTLPVGCTKVERECGRRFALVILQRDCARCSVFSSCSLEPLHPTATVCSNPWSLFLSFEFARLLPLCRHLLEPSCFRVSARMKKGSGKHSR